MKLHTKKQVAGSQLDEAIKLFFERRDPASIHTLIGASHQIMRDVASAHNVSYRCIVDELPQRESLRLKDWYRAVFAPRNFFKHADQDSNVILDFDPDENELWLLDSCILYGQLFVELSKPVLAFWTWYQVKYQETQAFLSKTDLLKITALLNIDAGDFAFFRQHCE